MHTGNTGPLQQYAQGTSVDQISCRADISEINAGANTSHYSTRANACHAERGEILYEQGDTSLPFFVVVSGEIEVVHPLGTAVVKTLVRVLGSGQFTGEVGILSGRRTLFRVRATKPGRVIELDRNTCSP